MRNNPTSAAGARRPFRPLGVSAMSDDKQPLKSAEDEEYDSFGAFEESTGAGVVRDPYPVFDDLRRQCPVHKGNMAEAFGFKDMPQPVFSESGEYYGVLSHEPVLFTVVQLRARAGLTAT